MRGYGERDFSLEKIRTVVGISIRILSFVNTLANSYRMNETAAWKECNRRLFDYYRTLAPELPENFREMEPLFLAVICGCHAGLFQRRCMTFTFRGSSVEMRALRLTFSVSEGHCFRFWFIFSKTDDGRSSILTGVEEQSLSAEDHLFILMQAAVYLSGQREELGCTRGTNLLRARGVPVPFP